MQLVLLIILEPTKHLFAETPESKVDFGGKNQRFAGRAGQHYLKYFHSTVVDSCGQIGGWDPVEPDRPMRELVYKGPTWSHAHISQVSFV